MDKVQKEMMDNTPVRSSDKNIVTKKRVCLALCGVACITIAYFIGPSILKKVHTLRTIKPV